MRPLDTDLLFGMPPPQEAVNYRSQIEYSRSEKNFFGIAKFVDRSNDRHDRNGHCLAAFRNLAHCRGYGHAFLGWGEGMRRAEIIGLT
jgi:hypothetical protein